MKALSIQQPWAQLIVEGLKDIENRTWRHSLRGEILVHAGKRVDTRAYIWLLNNWTQLGVPAAVGDLLDRYRTQPFATGGIVGRTTLIDCVREHPSPWKMPEQWGFVLAHSAPLPFQPCRGALGFFEPVLGQVATL